MPATANIKLYGRRFTIEESFRDIKDLHFGMGLSYSKIREPERRDKLLLIGGDRDDPDQSARRSRRETGYGPDARGVHGEEAHSLVAPPGLLLLRRDPEHAEERLVPLAETFGEPVRSEPVLAYVFSNE